MGPGLEIHLFDRVKLLGQRWYFRVVDTGNWEILAQSQTYKHPLQRNKTAKRLGELIDCPVIPERSKR